MASIQGGGRPAVDEALSSDSGQSRAHVVADVLTRRVTNGPPGLNDPPHQVDIFPVAQGGIEPSDLTDHRGSSDERGSGHVPDPMARTDHRGRRSEVERRVASLVSEQYRRCAVGWFPRDDPWRHGADPGVLEMARQRGEPVVGRLVERRVRKHIDVDEGYERGRNHRKTGIAGAARATRLGMANQRGPGILRRSRDQAGGGRS